MLTSRSLPQHIEQISPLTPGQWRRGLRVSQILHFMTGGLGSFIVASGRETAPVYGSDHLRWDEQAAIDDANARLKAGGCVHPRAVAADTICR